MNGYQLIEECSAAGVTIMVRGSRVSLEGDPELIDHYAPLLRPHKELIIACATGLAEEFMEVDGLSRSEAEALAAVSVTPRPPAEWLALIQELDNLIDRYCQASRLADNASDRIREARKSQSLVSIPLSVQWFKSELTRIESKP